MALNRWTPGPARTKDPSLGADVANGAGLRAADISGKDMIFCAEFAAHGGIALSKDGFRAEGELIRMQAAGLVNLKREAAAPFGVSRVELSSAMRRLLSGDSSNSGLVAVAAPASSPKSEANLRCNGFEVARFMIGAAVKAELSVAHQTPSGADPGLEARLMARISQLEIPFQA